MSDDTTSVPNSEPAFNEEPVLNEDTGEDISEDTASRDSSDDTVPQQMQPVSDDDVVLDGLLDDIDTISAADQESITADSESEAQSTDDDDATAVGIFDSEDTASEMPEMEQPLAYTAAEDAETTFIDTVLPGEDTSSGVFDDNVYIDPAETAVMESAETAVADIPVSVAPAAPVSVSSSSVEDAASSEPLDSSDLSDSDELLEDVHDGQEKDDNEDDKSKGWGTVDWGLFLLRVTLGVIMAMHGADKLFGLFGGSISATEDLLRSVGFTNHTEIFAIGAGVTELVSGIIVILGLFAPAGASVILGVMGMATLTHLALGEGAFLALYKGPYELITLIAAMSAAVIFAGSGRWSVDGRWGWATRPKWGAIVWFIVGIASAPIVWAIFNTQGFPF